ncbi:MAG: peptidoglycan-binding domain-containing protein [Pirellulales bacterium]
MTLKSKLFADDATLQAAAQNKPPLKKGAKGDGVGKLQRALVQLGYAMPKSTRSDGTFDGIYGDETTQKVWKFQSDQPPLAKDGQAGHDTLHKIDELVGTEGGGQFQGFTPAQEQTLRSDLQLARDISKRCTSILVPGPRNLPRRPGSIPFPVPPQTTLHPEVSGLLMDTFDIDGSNDALVFPIRQRYMNFSPRMHNTIFIFTEEHAPTQTHMGHAAFVRFNTLRPFISEIFFTKAYFDTVEPKKRACTIIHEYIHMVNIQPGHPGSTEGGMALFSRTRMGIEYGNAVLNPYCYDYFAEWSLDLKLS